MSVQTERVYRYTVYHGRKARHFATAKGARSFAARVGDAAVYTEILTYNAAGHCIGREEKELAQEISS